MNINRLIYTVFASLAFVAVSAQSPRSSENQRVGNEGNQKLNDDGRRVTEKKQEIEQIAYAWGVDGPTGAVTRMPMDTLEYNYFQQAIPAEVSYAYACTGNLGAEGKNMIFMQQAPISQFFLEDAQMAWIPTLAKHRWYNTRIPMTLVGYNTAGGRYNSQDRLEVIFSGNINKKAQIGANLDYIYSKGCYENQNTKGLTWGLDGSYLGDRYEFKGFTQHYNLLNKENGGITDDLYITDPAQLQGGISKIDAKSIPTNLTRAHTKIVGGQIYLNNMYKVGFWHEETDDNDSIIVREYVPVTSFFWTLDYKYAKHIFGDMMASETQKFFEHTYLNPNLTDDRTSYSSLTNTVGLSLLEDFNKYAKFGLAAYFKYEMRKFKQATDTIDRLMPDDIGLMPFPEGVESVLDKKSQNVAWVGGQLAKRNGKILTYQVNAEIGLVGDAAGEVKVWGNLATRIPMMGDTVPITAYGSLYNTSAPYLLNEYRSNHFIWQNNFGKERRLRFGGILNIPWTKTSVNIGTETLQNLIYFNDKALPQQDGGTVQVFSATLHQDFKLGILHWDNKLTYQTTTNDNVLPLPKFAIYSNLYLLCRIATLHLQLGVDCDYYTKYYAPAYQPATATFHNQRGMKLGNYPLMTAYANMKLGRTRFYVMMSHVNQGLIGGNNYFSSPHYPLNPRRFQLGLSIDFHN